MAAETTMQVEGTKGERTRRAILLAARKRFTAAGFDETTLGEVAAAAGVSGPTVAHHFGSKAGLLAAVVDDYYDDLVERIDAVIDAERSPMERLVAFARFWVAEIDERFPLYAIFGAYGGGRPSGRGAEGSLRRNNARVTQRFQRLVEDLQADGTLRAEVDTRLVRDAFFGTAEHVVRGRARPRRKLQHARIADDLLEVVLHGAAAPEQAVREDDRLGVIERKLDAVLARIGD